MAALNNGLKLLNVIPQVHYAVTLSADEEGHAAAVNAEGELFIIGNGEILTTDKINDGDDIYTCCTFAEDGLLYTGTSGSRIIAFELKDGHLNNRTTISTDKLSSIQSMVFTADDICFVCSDNGVGSFDSNGVFTVINTGEFSNSIDNMTIDYQGNLWFASSSWPLPVIPESRSSAHTE